MAQPPRRNKRASHKSGKVITDTHLTSEMKDFLTKEFAAMDGYIIDGKRYPMITWANLQEEKATYQRMNEWKEFLQHKVGEDTTSKGFTRKAVWGNT